MSELFTSPITGPERGQDSLLLDKVFNSIHVLIAYMDREFNFIRVNDRYAAADNRDADYFVGKNHFALYPNAENEAIFRQVVASGVPYFAYEKPFAYPASLERGTTYWDWSLEPVFGESGAVEGLVLSLAEVTHRVQAREQARASIESLQRMQAELIEAQRLAHVGSWRWDFAAGNVDWSDELYRIYGFAPQSLKPEMKTVLDIAYPDDRDRLRAFIDAVRQDGGHHQIEHRVVRPDGTVRQIHRDAETIHDEHGQVVAVRGTVQDITERRQAEARVRESEQRLRAMAEAIGDVFWMSTPGVGKMLYISPAYERLWGRSCESVYAQPRSFTDAVLAEDRPRLAHLFENHARGVPYEMEYRIARADGAVRWMYERGYPLRSDQGELVAMTGVVSDITDRKLAEQRLRHSEANLADAQRIAHVGNWEWDIIHDTLHWSDEIYRIFGLAPQQFPGTYEAFLATIHPDDRAQVENAVNATLQAASKETNIYSVEHRIVLPDQSIRYVHERGELTFDDAGRPARMLGTVQDITERKLGEMAQRKINRALRTLSRCNEILIHAREEPGLLADMCRTIVEEGGYRAVWVGFVAPDGKADLRLAGQAGLQAVMPEHPICVADAHPACVAARGERIRIVHDALTDPGYAPWREQAERFDYRSVLAIPFGSGSEPPAGVLSIYAAESNAFDEPEIALLSELAADLRYGVAALRTHKEREEAQRHLQRSLEATVHAVASTVEIRDPYTAGHQRRVAELAAAIARELGLSEADVTAIRLAGAVHDIGKIYIPAEILNRPGTLSDLEMNLVKSHVQVGHNILRGVEFVGQVAELVHQHHERLDGSGYPRHFHAQEILPGARIIAVADVVEAMASHRPYRPALGLDRALSEIETHRGTRYDPAAVDACLALFRENRFQFAATAGWH